MVLQELTLWRGNKKQLLEYIISLATNCNIYVSRSLINTYVLAICDNYNPNFVNVLFQGEASLSTFHIFKPGHPTHYGDHSAVIFNSSKNLLHNSLSNTISWFVRFINYTLIMSFSFSCIQY